MGAVAKVMEARKESELVRAMKKLGENLTQKWMGITASAMKA